MQSQNQGPRTGDPAHAALGNYQPIAGTPDEAIDANGQIRPAWRGFLERFATMSDEDRARRFSLGDQYLQDEGVFFRQYGATGSVERAWPLSHVPVMIHEREWKDISEGLIQRADLLEAVMADLYGDNRLVANGHLPASLIAASPEWLRPLVGAKPASGNFLHFLAFEIGRGPEGKWWVLGDRTQAPSGAGFALENRLATSRVFSDLFASYNVVRLAGFFRDFREGLQAQLRDRSGSLGILSPGPLNDTYFEHAYIARYLGFMLVEGEDLTVHNGEVMVRTVAGLRPLSVLWRRLDSTYADPLELDETSQLGTPGIVSAIRRGNLSMVNALGSGVLETRALLAFLPRICRHLNGEPLKMPNLATWWCGDPAKLEEVNANTDRMIIGSALATRPLNERDEDSLFGRDDPREFARRIAQDPRMTVAQEIVSLSTTPALGPNGLEPRAMALRVFVARTRDGWKVMPGGYARIGKAQDSNALAMQRGGSVADVWIVSDQPVAPDTLTGPSSRLLAPPLPGTLPSRAADNLYWLGRYVERAEHRIRLLRAYHARLADAGSDEAELINYLGIRLGWMGLDINQGVPQMLSLTLDKAIACASRVRDRFSIDGWMALNDLAKTVREFAPKVQVGDDAARALNVLLRKVSGFTGLVHENMYRFTGWRFLSIGRSQERAISMAALLAVFGSKEAPVGALDLAIEIGDSVMTHRQRYSVSTHHDTVLDLLVFDTLNPRSILYHLNSIRDQVSALPGANEGGMMSPLMRTVTQVIGSTASRTPDAITAEDLHRLGNELSTISEQLSATYLK